MHIIPLPPRAAYSLSSFKVGGMAKQHDQNFYRFPVASGVGDKLAHVTILVQVSVVGIHHVLVVDVITLNRRMKAVEWCLDETRADSFRMSPSLELLEIEIGK